MYATLCCSVSLLDVSFVILRLLRERRYTSSLIRRYVQEVSPRNIWCRFITYLMYKVQSWCNLFRRYVDHFYNDVTRDCESIVLFSTYAWYSAKIEVDFLVHTMLYCFEYVLKGCRNVAENVESVVAFLSYISQSEWESAVEKSMKTIECHEMLSAAGLFWYASPFCYHQKVSVISH